jgi:hypothetical protein
MNVRLREKLEGAANVFTFGFLAGAGFWLGWHLWPWLFQ